MTMLDRRLPQASDRDVLGMMTKYWVPGTVKTRLAHSVGAVTAAEIHRQFTLHLVTSLANVAARRVVFAAPDEACELVRQETGVRWEVSPQGNGDLGERIQRSFEKQLEADGRDPGKSAILIGADMPTLTPSDLRAAFAMLKNNDVVLGPAIDGGYYLIGIRGPWRESLARLFDRIPWSTPEVFAITMGRIADLGLSVGLLENHEDVDTLDSLQRLLVSDALDESLRKFILTLVTPFARDSSKPS